MTENTIVDVVDIAQTYPLKLHNEVDRVNLLNSVQRIYEKGVEAVSFEGEDGIGKTILLRQFCEKFSTNSISLFIRAASPLAYDISNIRFDLMNQISWISSGIQLDTEIDVSDIDIRDSLMHLQRIAKRRGKTFYFVIDSVLDIPVESKHIRSAIINLLPFGTNGFKYLFSGDISKIMGDKLRLIETKEFPVPQLSLVETEVFFDSEVKNKDYINEIYKTTNGIPGNCASVRRIIESGIDIDDFINDIPVHLKELLDLEWQNVPDERELLLTLSIITFDRKLSKLDEISLILECDKNVLIEKLNKLNFINFEEDSGTIEFASESFRKYAANKLHKYKKEIEDLIVERFLKNKDSHQSLLSLPDYLHDSKRYKDLIEILSKEHLKKVLDNTLMVGSVTKQIDLGLSAAKKAKDAGALFMMANSKSSLVDVCVSGSKKYEAEALVRANRYQEAISLANSGTYIEDRIQILSVIARVLKERGENIESTILEQIDILIEELDPSSLHTDLAVDIATDLFVTRPDAAINIVEKSISDNDSENSIDFALAQLSVNTLANESNENDALDHIDKLQSKISSKSIKRFLSTATAVLNSPEINTFISELEKIEKVGDRLFIIRRWLSDTPKYEHAGKLIEYAVDLAISTTEFVPSAGFYRDVSIAIEFIVNPEKRKYLIGIIDGQKNVIEKQGPTEDFIRLQLSLAKAEAINSVESVCDRLIDVYFKISSLDELSTKTTCLAWYVSSLKSIDSKSILEEREGLHTISSDEFKLNIDLLLSTTADHFNAVKNILVALSNKCYEYAVEIANSLNTVGRRDKAYSHIIYSMKCDEEYLLTDRVSGIIKNKIESLYEKDLSILNVVEKIYDQHINEESVDCEIDNIIVLLSHVSGTECRCKVTLLLYLMIKNIDGYATLIDELRGDILTSLNSVSAGWRRIELAYICVSKLPDGMDDMCSDLLKIADECKKYVIATSKNEYSAINNAIILFVNSFRGLIDSNSVTKLDFDVVRHIIEHMDSECDKAKMWSYISCFYYLNGDYEKAKNISSTYVRTAYGNINDNDKIQKHKTLVTILPSLWIYDKEMAKEFASNLVKSNSDHAYNLLVEFLIKKTLPGYPSEEFSKNKLHASYDEILDVLEVINDVESDSLIYSIIELITNVVLSSKKNAKLTREQVNGIATKLEKLIDEKLPSYRYIKHDGYKIVSKARLGLIVKYDKSEWKKFEDQANNIPNIADKIIILALISSSMPSKMHKDSLRLLGDARTLIDEIPSLFDKLDRYETITDIALSIDKGLSKKFMTEAFSLISNTKDVDLHRSEKRLIDLAHRIDPELPSSLAALANDDPARSGFAKNVNKQKKLQDLKGKIADERKGDILDVEVSNPDLPNITWKLLGGLSSGRIVPVHIQRIRDLIYQGAYFPLSEGFPIFAYSVENLRLMYKDTKQAEEILRPIFEASLHSLELTIEIISTRSEKILKNRKVTLSRDESASIVIGKGEGKEAIKYIKNWLSDIETNNIMICDPYFGPDDLEVLQLVLEKNPYCQIKILTSLQHQISQKIVKPFDDSYNTYWRNNISDQDPPQTEIIIVGTSNEGKTPIHDRWILSDSSGLRLGTSFNSFGKKVSEISRMSEQDSAIVFEKIDPYFLKTCREHIGERLIYSTFELY